MGQVIAVVSGKGGTGKTSFTALVGSALAEMGHRTLCLDCDVGLRNLDLALGMSDSALMDFTDVIAGRATLEQAAVRHPYGCRLYLLTAPIGLHEDIRTSEMKRLLDEVRSRFDYCLIDSGAGLGDAFRLATCAADRAVVVATTDPTSLRDAQRTVMELRDYPNGRLHLVINRVRRKLLKALSSNIDDAIDAAGLPFLKNMTPPAGSKSVEELAEIVQLAERPFIVKGVMTVKGALKAKQAGAAAIVVSNHGGRVLDQCPATAEVLPEIAAALKGTGVKVLVDGGIRTGVDVFKALALGADGVLICRPFVTAVYGGGTEGVKCYIDKLAGELADTMQMCGAHTLAEITPDMVRV